eukprot:tig00000430_g650.t1
MFAWLRNLISECKAPVLVGFAAVCWMPLHTIITAFIRWRLRSMNTAIIYGSGFGVIFGGFYLLLSYVSLREEHVGIRKVLPHTKRPATPMEAVWARRAKVAVFSIALLSSGGAAVIAPIFANALVGYVNYDDGSGLYAPPISVAEVANHVLHGFTLFPQFTDGEILKGTLAPEDCISAKDYDLSWSGTEDDPVDYFCVTPVAPSLENYKAVGKVSFWLAARAPTAQVVPTLFEHGFPGHAITPSVENVARYRGAALIMSRRYGFAPSQAPMLLNADPHDRRAEYFVTLMYTASAAAAVFGVSLLVYLAILLLYFNPRLSDCLAPIPVPPEAPPGPDPASPQPLPVGGSGVPLPPQLMPPAVDGRAAAPSSSSSRPPSPGSLGSGSAPTSPPPPAVVDTSASASL